MQPLSEQAAQLTAPDAMAPPSARDAWLRCTVLTWEVRQRARLQPLLDTLRMVEASRDFAGAEPELMRLFFSVLGGAYIMAGAPLPLPPLRTLFSQPPAAMAAELALLTAALRAEVDAQQARGTVFSRCPFTGATIWLLPDKRIALRLSAGV